MKILTSIIDLESIKVNNSSFSITEKATQIEALANTIIELGGLINIPVVKQINIDDYELISGYLEYYAYVKACEINSNLPDRITVFISNSQNQTAINKQLDILATIDNSNQHLDENKNLINTEINLKLKNLESSINNSNKNISDALEKQKLELLSVIDAKIPQPVPPIDSFNRILEPEIAFQVQRKLELILGKAKGKKFVTFLQEASKRKDYKPFQTFSEVIDVLKSSNGKRLISEVTMLNIIDKWYG
jgi:hypothetical protein